MSLTNFRLPPHQTNLQYVKVISDEGKVRAVAQIARDIIEDSFPDENYHRDRFAIVERNLGVLASIIQRKYAAREYIDYTDDLGIKSGNDKLIVIDGSALLGRKQAPAPIAFS
jgi:hypothetical protein